MLTGGPYPLRPALITSGAMYCIVPEDNRSIVDNFAEFQSTVHVH